MRLNFIFTSIYFQVSDIIIFTMPDIMIDYITISWRDRGSENLFVSTNTMASILKIQYISLDEKCIIISQGTHQMQISANIDQTVTLLLGVALSFIWHTNTSCFRIYLSLSHYILLRKRVHCIITRTIDDLKFHDLFLIPYDLQKISIIICMFMKLF